MRKLGHISSLLLIISCTSNTILEPPKDLIPKDTMSLLIQDMMLASSARFIKNEDMQKKVNYMPLVYEKFKIDSVRFQSSNFYYMSKIDDYIKIFEDAKSNLEQQKKKLENYKKGLDSIRKDSIKKSLITNKQQDSMRFKKKFNTPKKTADLDEIE